MPVSERSNSVVSMSACTKASRIFTFTSPLWVSVQFCNQSFCGSGVMPCAARIALPSSARKQGKPPNSLPFQQVVTALEPSSVSGGWPGVESQYWPQAEPYSQTLRSAL